MVVSTVLRAGVQNTSGIPRSGHASVFPGEESLFTTTGRLCPTPEVLC
jgi:hypothetical protein